MTEKKKILILYYSFSSQTKNILLSLARGMEKAGAEVSFEPLVLVEPRKFPIGSYHGTLKAMVTTFFRQQIAIKPLSDVKTKKWDLIVVGGPTWSFQPSGPILFLLNHEETAFLAGKKILPVISCRRYWKHNYKSIVRILGKAGSEIMKPVVLSHPVREPWCTIGLFLKLSGRVPEARKSFFSKYYPKYGHTKEQLKLAGDAGLEIGRHLVKNEKAFYNVPLITR